MPIIFKNTNGILYQNPTGQFCLWGTDNIINTSKRCRVEIAWDWDKLENNNFIGLYILDKNKEDLKRVKKFWKFIEKKLGKKFAIKILETTIPNLTAFKLPKFWHENQTVRSLFTLLLRYAFVYFKSDECNEKTFYKDFVKYPLIQAVKPAIIHFLNGNTRPTYKDWSRRDREGYFGFVAEFQDISQDVLDTKLIKG